MLCPNPVKFFPIDTVRLGVDHLPVFKCLFCSCVAVDENADLETCLESDPSHEKRWILHTIRFVDSRFFWLLLSSLYF